MAGELDRQLQERARMTSHVTGSREYYAELNQMLQRGRESGFMPDYIQGRVSPVEVPGLIGVDHPLVHVFSGEGTGVVEWYELGLDLKDQYASVMEAGGARMGGVYRSLIGYDSFQILETPTMVLTGTVSLGDLSGSTKSLNYSEILALDLLEDGYVTRTPHETSGRWRLKHMDQPKGEIVWFLTDTVPGPVGNPKVLLAHRDDDDRWLASYWAGPGRRFHPGSSWVVGLPLQQVQNSVA